jgi:transposase InsO family protein
VGWNLSHRCRTEDALVAVEQAVLERLPEGSREANVTLTTDNGTQFTSSRFMETLNRLGITHRRTAYHHPEGNSYIERFHRSLKEEEVWTAEYRSLEEARASSLVGSRSTITTGLIAESEIALRTRPSWLLRSFRTEPVPITPWPTTAVGHPG